MPNRELRHAQRDSRSRLFARIVCRCCLMLFTAWLCSSGGCRPGSEKSHPSQPVSDASLSATSSSAAPVPMVTFRDRASDEVARCDFHSGREAGLNSILEIVGGGVGCIDYDLDGSCDLFFPRGGHIDAENRQITGINSALVRGDAAWNFSDRTEQTHIDTSRIYSHGVSAVDFDHDGWSDLLVYGYRGVILLQNLGDGTFRDVTDFDDPAQQTWTTAAAWIDLNDDRLLDVYLGSYVNWDFDRHQICESAGGKPDVCSPNVYEGSQNYAYINNGDGSFSWAEEMLQSPQPAKTLALLAAEFSPGERCGMYVANDLIPNFLFTRRAARGSDRFEEHGFISGVAVDDRGMVNGSMGLALLDFNLDRQFDLFVTNFEHEMMALYINAGSDLFHHYSRQAGLNKSDLRLVGFGTVAADFDGDADEDIVFTAGHVYYHPASNTIEQLPAYLENVSGRSLSKTEPKCRFFTEPNVGRGLAAADLDNDGDLDLIATHLLGAPALVENVTRATSNWLTVTLVGTDSSRTPVGAVVELASGPTTLVRQLYSGGSYLSQSQQQLHFTWPRDASHTNRASLTVHWPDGAATESLTIDPNQHLVIAQGKNTK